MRIWHVPYGELDGQRVLGQHNEIHALWGLIVKYGNPWGGLSSDDQEYLMHIHTLTVLEMNARGWNGHQTPLNPIVRRNVSETLQRLKPLEERQALDRWHLVLRWGGVYKGRTPCPTEYVEPISKYWHQGGCLHDGPWEDDTKLCLLCKRVKRKPNGEVVPR